MEQERKTTLLAALTLLIYGLVSFLGGGPFAFFPVNEIIFAGITIYFSVNHFKSASVSYMLMSLFALLSLLNNQLLLGFFMDYADSQRFHENQVVKILKLSAYLFLLIEISRFCFKAKGKVAVLFYPLIFISLVAGVWYSTHLFVVFGLIVFASIIQFTYKTNQEMKKKYPKPLFYLWILLCFLKFTTLLTIYLYDLNLEI